MWMLGTMNSPDKIKEVLADIVRKYSCKSDAKALIQNLNTLIPYFVLFYLAIVSWETSVWLSAIFTLLLSFFTVRIFMLMHDCGHKSLFKTQLYNTLDGVLTGVLVGMPQYVWAQHHNYHHATNGNWQKYRGPLNILSVNEYKKLSSFKQHRYRGLRNILLGPIGAFLYFIFNPRFTWILGSLQFAFNLVKKKIQNPGDSFTRIMAAYKSRFWNTSKEYLHMTLNNIILLVIWVAASWFFGAAAFFTVYIISLSLAGAVALIIFTVQHNFEGSYASDNERWDYNTAALKGTSFLTFPKVFNWFGADIVYHHIHHISAGIPNYNLAACHQEYAYLFEEVTRIKLGGVPGALKYILWDEDGERIISVKQYNQMNSSK